MRFDHLSIPVTNWIASRDWYVNVLGLTVEFQIPERHTVALQDGNDFTFFLSEADNTVRSHGIAFTFQVDEVHAACAAIAARGGRFSHPPQKVFWGYGAEIADPDGYLVRLWDEISMKEKG
jgi:predicted enzyme related to lactoylglutathione lyase